MDPKIRNEARGERTPHAHRSSFPLPFDNFVKLVSKASVTSREKKRSISASVSQESPLSKWLVSTPGIFPV